MIDLECSKINKVISCGECKECFEKNRWCDTRAQCVKRNAKYVSPIYIKMHKGWEPSAADEMISGLMEMDPECCFEVNGIIMININKVGDHINAIKTFQYQIAREGYTKITMKEMQSIGISGIWYKRYIRK